MIWRCYTTAEITCCFKNELLICGELRSPDDEGKKDKITVNSAIATMLPIKNFANHSSLTSWLEFRLGEDIIILVFVVKELIEGGV